MITDFTSYIKNFPELPGVYLMKDSMGEIVYIGKAIKLKSRVASYFNGSDDRIQIESLLERIVQIEFIVTKDERQALVLEADLVRRHQPRYNIRLKDDKSPLLIRLDLCEEWPRVHLVRKKLNDGAKYFGPFPFSYEARTIMDIIERAVPLRTCSDKILRNRVRPCLQYQIQRCSGPCCLPVDKAEYSDWVEQALEILKGNVEDVVLKLQNSMEGASRELRFEDAAVIRDRLKVITKVKTDFSNALYGENSIDAFGIYREGSFAEVSILKTDQGRLSDSFTFGFDDVSISSSEVICSVISQYYESANVHCPNEIVLPFPIDDQELLDLFLKDKFGKSVRIVFPQRGVRYRLLELANINAKENFEARFSGKSKLDRILQTLQDTLGFEQYPRIIECIDISHIQGKATVGAVVCFKDGRPDPSRYRYFHLSQEGKPDDFASMNEVVRRHLVRACDEGTIADLLIIDGGPPQLQQALKVRKELAVNYPSMISIAKKREPLKFLKVRKGPRDRVVIKKPERLYVEENPIPIILEPNNEVLKLLERIRNETHRSAITFHRKTRSRLQFASPLDQVRGLGPKRKLLLLRKFGSIEGIRQASTEELSLKGEISYKLAESIKKVVK